MRQRLVGTAHDAEADVQVAALHERRDDGVERALAAGEHVGMLGIERESGAAILQSEAHAVDRDAGTEIAEDALNPARDVAVVVDHGQIGGIACRPAGRRRPRSWPCADRSARRACGRSPSRAASPPARRRCADRRRSGGRRSTPASWPRCACAFRRRLKGPAGVGGRRLHDVQHFERGHALAVGRQFVDAPAAIVDGNGLAPTRPRTTTDLRRSWCRPGACEVLRMAAAISPL